MDPPVPWRLSHHRATVAQAVSATRLVRPNDSMGPGSTRGIPESFAPTLQHWVKEVPQNCGLDRANWTYEELAVHFYRTTGIEVKGTAILLLAGGCPSDKVKV